MQNNEDLVEDKEAEIPVTKKHEQPSAEPVKLPPVKAPKKEPKKTEDKKKT